jgi:hypothetical protein
MKLPRLLTSAGGTIQRQTRLPAVVVEQRGSPIPEWYQNLFSFNGSQYLVGQFRNANAGYLARACGPVYSVLDRRASVMGEARPTFQRLERGKPTEFYSTRELEILKRPWRGGSFRRLIKICESDDAGAGNSYWVRSGKSLVRLEPDWVTIVTGEYLYEGVQVGYELVGYAVQRPGHQGIVLEPDEVAHYAPGFSVDSPFRGESWLAAVASDASSDLEMTQYKGNYLKNGGLPSLAVMYEPTLDMAQLEAFVPVFAEKFTGSVNAGKVMHFLGGRDVKTIGASLDQLAFKAVQGAGETRIASAGGVPASVAMISEGNEGSTLNTGNYGAARRLFGDAKIRPNLGAFCEAFSTLIKVPADSRLWYDDSQVSFFQEDVTDEAGIRQLIAQTVKTYIEAGFEPDASLIAATTGNTAALRGHHTGLTSVQLQPPDDGTEPDSSEGGNDDEPTD